MAKQFKHRAIQVGENHVISLCESCAHMPSGRVPQSNEELNNGTPEKAYLYCIKKAFFPRIDYSNEGKPFYDVAKCDKYELFEQIVAKIQKKQEINIERPEDEV